MSYRSSRRPPPPRRRGGRGCLGALVALVWIVLLGLLAYRFFFQPQVSNYVGEQIAQQLEQQGSVNSQIEGAANQALPTVVAALPSGELRISEQQVNDYIASHAQSVQPLDSVRMRFEQDVAVVELGAFGTTSSLQMGLVAQNGQILAVNPRLDGPIGQLISADDLLQSIQNQINRQLANQERRVTAARVEPGALVLTVE